MLGACGNPACWEHKAATRGQRTAGNLCSRPQPTAKLPGCSRSSVRTSVPLTLAEALASGRRGRIPPSSAPPEEKLQRGSRDGAAVGAGVPRTAPARARRGAGCPARGRGSGGQRREPPTSTPERAGSRRVELEPAPGASANPSASPSCFAGRPRTHIRSSGVVTSARRLERGPDRKRSGELSRRMPGCWLCPQAARQRWQGRQSG